MRPIPLWTLALIALAAMSSSSLPAAQTPAVRQPENVMTLLPNGMRLVAAPRSYNKVLSLNLFIEGGSAEDPPAKEGLTNLTQRLLLKGAAGKDAEELAETIESVGGHIGVATTNDYSEVSTVCTVEELDTALELLADVVLRPSFPDDEVERERQLVLSGIKRREDNPSGFTYLRFLREMYEGHPYAHPVEGEDLPVRTISREEIAAFHAQRLRPERMILAACGDVKTEDLAVKVQEAFEKIPTAMTAPRFIIGRQIKPHFVMQTLHKDVRQAFVVTGFPAIPLSDPDYPALRIAHAMLGEGMSSRLFRRLRDEQSMAYDVGSRVEARKVAGHLALWIGTSPDNAENARLSLLSEARYLTEGATDEEFERAKNYVLGKILISRQSNQAKAHSLGSHEAMGLGFMFEDVLVEALKRVEKEEALQTLARYLTTPVSVILLPE